MSTPVMAFTGWMRNVLVTFWFIWISTMIISRIYIFHDAYTHESQKRVDERYLLSKCNDPEFYSNIRQHTDICTSVAENAQSSILLKALNTVAINTHICGNSPCSEVIHGIVSRMGWHAAAAILIVSLLFPNLMLSVLRCLANRGMEARERALQKHTEKYGMESSHSPFYSTMEDLNDCGSWKSSRSEFGSLVRHRLNEAKAMNIPFIQSAQQPPEPNVVKLV